MKLQAEPPEKTTNEESDIVSDPKKQGKESEQCFFNSLALGLDLRSSLTQSPSMDLLVPLKLS